MHYAVYAPLLVSLGLAAAARPVSRRLPPALAAALLAVCALVAAVASSAVLVLLAALLAARLPAVAAAGGWSAERLAHTTPVPPSVSVAATALLVVVLVRGVVALQRHLRSARAARALCRSTPAAAGGGLVVLGSGFDAFALAGDGGRVVVSRAVLQGLDAAERRALLAHERAHLEGRHHLLRTAAAVGSALDPVLSGVPAAVRFATERSADEHAVHEVHDRAVVARALARTSLLARRSRAALAVAAMGAAGPDVVERVGALARPPVPSRPGLVTAVSCAAALLLVGAVATSAHAVGDAGELLQRAGTTSWSAGHHGGHAPGSGVGDRQHRR